MISNLLPITIYITALLAFNVVAFTAYSLPTITLPLSQLQNVVLHESSNTIDNDPRTEPRSTIRLSIPRPLGLILEEMDSDPSHGVVIVGIAPNGNAAKRNLHAFANKSQYVKEKESSSIGQDCICIRDKITSINGTPCHDQSLEQVMQQIHESTSHEVLVEVGRMEPSTILHYSRGQCIAAKAGESYGFLAKKCGVDIEYECRTGNCQTCSRYMEFPDKRNCEASERRIYGRTILNCVGTVPRNYEWLDISCE